MFCSESMKRFYSFNQMYLLACLVGLCVCVCSMYIYNSNRIVFLWMICNRVQGIFLLISEEVSSFMKRPLFLQCFKCLWCHKSQRKQWHPLQCPCLENPMDGGAWWAAVHGVWKVGHDWVTSHSLFTCMHWRRKWQPTPVFLPGESQGRGSLVGCRLSGRTESDTTEVT